MRFWGFAENNDLKMQFGNAENLSTLKIAGAEM